MALFLSTLIRCFMEFSQSSDKKAEISFETECSRVTMVIVKKDKLGLVKCKKTG